MVQLAIIIAIVAVIATVAVFSIALWLYRDNKRRREQRKGRSSRLTVCSTSLEGKKCCDNGEQAGTMELILAYGPKLTRRDWEYDESHAEGDYVDDDVTDQASRHLFSTVAL